MHPASRYEAQFAEARRRARLPGLTELRTEIERRHRELQAINWDSLSAEGCRKLREGLVKNQLPPETYVNAVEGELARPVTPAPEPGWLRLPGLKLREQRLFRNDFMAMLERTRAGQSFEVLGADTSPDWDWFFGRHGVLRTPFIVPMVSCHEEYERLHEAEAFTHLLSVIMEEHALSQQWPVSLREIPGYEPLPPLILKEAKYEALGVNLDVNWRGWSLKRPALRPQ